MVSRTIAVFERLTNDQTPGLEQTTLTDVAGWQEQLRYAQNREVSDGAARRLVCLQARQKNFFAQICPCFLRFANFGQIPDN